jgi:hypothetical protein
MKFIKKYEDYKPKVYKDYIKVDLTQFEGGRDGLKELLVGKIVSFNGQNEDKSFYEDVKLKISDLYYTGGLRNDHPEYEFETQPHNQYYKVDSSRPVKIYITETDADNIIYKKIIYTSDEIFEIF